MACNHLVRVGAFRIHEVLARESMSFDPTATLVTKDVNLSTVIVRGVVYEVVKVLLRHPKEERLSAGVTIDLFQVTGEASWLCAVTAYKKWRGEWSTKPFTVLSPSLE